MLLWARHRQSREGKETLGLGTSASVTQDSTGAQGGRSKPLPSSQILLDVEASARGDEVGTPQVSKATEPGAYNGSRGDSPERIQSDATPIPNVDGADPEVCVAIRKQIPAAAPRSHRPLIAVLVLGAAEAGAARWSPAGGSTGRGRMTSPWGHSADLARFYTVTEPQRHPKGYTVYKVTARVSAWMGTLGGAGLWAAAGCGES